MHYDLIVIGGGPGGTGAAIYAAKHGMAVALVEKDKLGGACLHRGCVPTKAYLHHVERAVQALPFAPDATRALNRREMLRQKDELVSQLAQDLHMQMKAHKITLYEGVGTLKTTEAPFGVRIKDAEGKTKAITADKVLLATGSKPARLSVPGCEHPEVWTSDELLGEAGAVAFHSLIIVGGGVIGVEMAFLHARQGVEVTIVETEKTCLPMMDRDLSRSAEALLEGLGVTLLTGARLQSVDKSADGFAVQVYRDGMQILPCHRVLLATGRKAQTQGLLSPGDALATQGGALLVDMAFQCSVPGIYAIGDVNGQWQLAHAAQAQGMAAVSHMLGEEPPIDTRIVPSCVYTTPEIATVGLTQDIAKVQEREVQVGKVLTTHNARSLMDGMGRGFIKLVADKHTKQLLGAQLYCGRATDLLGELTLAIEQGLSATELLRPLRAHPTFYEAVTEAVEALL